VLAFWSSESRLKQLSSLLFIEIVLSTINRVYNYLYASFPSQSYDYQDTVIKFAFKFFTKRFMAVNYDFSQKARAFVHGKLFQRILMFVGKARSLP
jgi:hypothetical protein